MFSYSLFVKIDKLNIKNIHDSIMINEYIETCICYIIKKILVNNYYSHLDIRYNYSEYKINQAFNIAEQICIEDHILHNLLCLSNLLNKHIEKSVDDFHIHNSNIPSIMNFNSILVNTDSLLLTCEVFSK